MVPTKKDKERHLARFLDIFKKLEITMAFGEVLQQMSLYYKFLKDMLTRNNKYIQSENIIVEGNCCVVIQRILPPKHKDPESVFRVQLVKFLLVRLLLIWEPVLI